MKSLTWDLWEKIKGTIYLLSPIPNIRKKDDKEKAVGEILRLNCIKRWLWFLGRFYEGRIP